MCSIGEDDFGDEGGLHTMPGTVTDLEQQTDDPNAFICRPCSAAPSASGPVPAAVKLPCKEPQCRDCFLTYARHKFRANLGANKCIPRNGRVLVCYDGGRNSSVLLDMLRFATTQDRFKKLHVEPLVLYVDEACLSEVDATESGAVDESLQQKKRADRLRGLCSVLQQFAGMQAYYVSIAQPIDTLGLISIASPDTGALQDAAIAASACEQAFIDRLRCFASLTARQELVRSVRTRLQRVSARHLGIEFVLEADTCVDLSARLLANIALGRGTSVGDDVAFRDARHGSAEPQTLRPLRDFSQLEIAEYVRLAAVPVAAGEVAVHAYGAANECDSIQNLTRAFVDGLQADFQSTVSTIFRTGSKIAAASTTGSKPAQRSSTVAAETVVANRSKQCIVCASALDCEQSETLLAVEFSRQCMLQQTNGDDQRGPATDEKAALCYGCRNVFSDLRTGDELNENLNYFKSLG